MLNRIFRLTSSVQLGMALIGLMFLLPFLVLHHSLPIPLFYSEWLAAALGTAAMIPLFYIASWQTPAKQSIDIPLISLIFIALAVILCAQWISGMLHSNQYGLLVLSYLILAFLLTVLGSHLRRTLGWEALVTTLAWCLVIGGIINTGIVFLQLVARTGGAIAWLPDSIGYGAISQTNHFANFIALSIASLFYLYIKRCFTFSFFSLILICFIMMLSFAGSRSAWLYLAAFSVLAFFLHHQTIKQGADSVITASLLRVCLISLPAFAIIQLIIYYLLPADLVTLPTARLIEVSVASTPSARLHVWYDSLRLFIDSPWLGIGMGNMRAESFILLDYPTTMAIKRVFEHAHNLFLHLLAEMGIGAFLIVTAGLMIWIRTFNWHQLKLETWWLIALLAVLGIHSMLEYPLWYAYFLGIAAILLGAGNEKQISLSLPKCIGNLSARFISRLKYLGLGSIMLLGLINLCTLLIANSKLENWVQNYRYHNTNNQAELDWVKQYSILAPYADLLNAMSMTIDRSNINKQVQLSESAMRFIPFKKIPYQHALLLELKGNHEDALKHLRLTIIGYPADTKIILGYVPLEYQQDYLNLLQEMRPENVRSGGNIVNH